MNFTSLRIYNILKKWKSSSKSLETKVETWRNELDKPVEWLAWESETSRATIRRIFDGDRNIGIITIDRVAKALGYKNGVKDLLNDI